MKGYFINSGTTVLVYSGGFDKSWVCKLNSCKVIHITRKDIFIDINDCNVIDDDYGNQILLANYNSEDDRVFGIVAEFNEVESSWVREDIIDDHRMSPAAFSMYYGKAYPMHNTKGEYQWT
jgi:hypothetical protein